MRENVESAFDIGPDVLIGSQIRRGIRRKRYAEHTVIQNPVVGYDMLIVIELVHVDIGLIQNVFLLLRHNSLLWLNRQ